jgi:hypothetical protein
MVIIERTCPRCANKYVVEITRGRRMCLNCTLRRTAGGALHPPLHAGREPGREEPS